MRTETSDGFKAKLMAKQAAPAAKPQGATKPAGTAPKALPRASSAMVTKGS